MDISEWKLNGNSPVLEDLKEISMWETHIKIVVSKEREDFRV